MNLDREDKNSTRSKKLPCNFGDKSQPREEGSKLMYGTTPSSRQMAVGVSVHIYLYVER